MKMLFKLAMGAAIAGALVSLLRKQQGSGNRDATEGGNAEGTETFRPENVERGTTGFTVGELVADAQPSDPQQPGAMS
jgi:hypothetical protein